MTRKPRVVKLHKLWIRRRAVGTMIGGIIILTIFAGALVFMFVLSEQYDQYQSTAAAMQQRQIDMYSENILAVFPGITNGTGTLSGGDYQVSCAGGGQCNNYTVVMNNLGITTQVVSLYIYQSGSTSLCGSNVCIINPANTAPPSPNSIRVPRNQVGDTVNSGEYAHYLVFYLPSSGPSGTSLSICTIVLQCKVSIATARGRLFSFLYPFSLSTPGSGGNAGGTGLYIGPLVITFQKALITYTNTQCSPCIPPVPIGGNNGYWLLPSGTLIIYVKIQTDINVPNDVYLTPQSVFEIARFDNPGAVNYFFAIAPITPAFCQNFIPSPNPNGYNGDLDCTLGTYQCSPLPSCGNTGTINTIVPYNACGNLPSTYASCAGRYVIPKPTQPNTKGKPVIVAFAVSKVSGGKNNLQNLQAAWNGQSATSFLGLSYVYYDPTDTQHLGPYLYGVTLPFISMCIQSCSF